MSKWHKATECPKDGIYWWTGHPKYQKPVLCQVRKKVWKDLFNKEQTILTQEAGGWWCEL